ncbi:MAG: 23S rRNA (guanosine(2251)-2'-O)-methyltransferase RlmB [Coriobacteriales bacterium]|nr:23S rRNA (guanosine(2251)-2'-O)-methyltransferase RlmB [Coriobacteriales bacterium]
MPNYVEGRRAIEEVLRAGITIKQAFVQEQARGATAPHYARFNKGKKRDNGADVPEASREDTSQKPQADAALNKLVDKLRKLGVKVTVVPRSTLDAMSATSGSHGAHQGIICEIPEHVYADIADIAQKGSQKDASLILVLDHITDEGNLGAIIRTAEVVGAEGVVIPSKRAAQVTGGVYKTSAGAALHIPIARVSNLVGALKSLKRAGYWVAGASEAAPSDVWHAPMHGRIALVSGAEHDGISRIVGEECDFFVRLPQFGEVGSLNVAQATTAIAYEWMRRTVMEQEERASATKDKA